jgi:outer membrane protein TolC
MKFHQVQPHWRTLEAPQYGAAGRRAKTGMFGLWAAIIFALSGNSTAQGDTRSSSTPAPAAVLKSLDTRSFLQMLVAQNLEIQYSRISLEVSRRLEGAERSLYEPIFFANLRREGRERQRSIDEVQTYGSGKNLLDENSSSTDLGIRGKLVTGAELSLSYKASQKSNNLIPQYSFGFLDTEHNGLLSVTIRQPLLRNAGRSVIETDLRIAELEQQVAVAQLLQQTQKACIDGLNLYWQLHRAQESLRLRQEALSLSEALIKDAQSRIEAGKLPPNSLAELQGAVISRQADIFRSEQALQEARSKLTTTINLIWHPQLQITTKPSPSVSDSTSVDRVNDLENGLRLWSPHVVALIRQQQAQVRLSFAGNQKKPNLDLIMGYSATGLAYQRDQAYRTTLGGRYPDWYIGINLELPTNGNQRSEQQYLAQVARTEQAALELVAIRNSYANDLNLRLAELEASQNAVQLADKDLQLRRELFINEQSRTQLGSGSLGNLLQKQSDWLEARQRYLESQIRVEISAATLQYTRGRLLADNGIVLEEVKPSP